MTSTLEKLLRTTIESNLSLCTESQQMLFKRMYSPKNLSLSTDIVVNQMPQEKLEWALHQVEGTLKCNNQKG